ncbi:MAG: alpha/beta hydrolase [Desulfobacteraceae bacterium]|nr:MAG: alpha/beta hydrolase [Desulfobacteraceae bacterium]
MNFSETRMDVLRTADGLSLDIHIWEPEKPEAIILAIHGGLAHAGDYVTPALFFKKKGLATAAYDLRGHKQEKTFIKDFRLFHEDTELFLGWGRKEYQNLPIFIMAHSMGSLIVTHLGIKTAIDRFGVKGFIMSSPYYENAVKVSPVMIPMVKIMGRLIPRMVIPSPDITDLLTHDKAITRRHREDEQAGLRSAKPTMRFGSELLKAQKWVKENITKWHHPLFAVVAGNDHVADPAEAERLLKRINKKHLTYLYHKDNYHENYNETNREETFARIYDWIGTLIES